MRLMVHTGYRALSATCRDDTLLIMHNHKSRDIHKGTLTGNATVSSHRGDGERTVTSVEAAQDAIDTVNAMGEGVVLFRLDGTVTAVNPALETLTAMRREELVGKNLRAIIPHILEGDERIMVLRAIEAVAQGDTPKLNPVVLMRATNAPLTISPAISWVRSPDGTPVSAVLTLKDVTDLHRTAELMNTIFDNTLMQIVYLDTRLRYVRVNHAYAEARGHESFFFPGKNHFDLYPHPENEAIFREVLATGERYAAYEEAFECPEQPALGVTYWDWSVRPIRCGKGGTEGLLLCLLNVTTRVRSRRRQEESDSKYRELIENANSIIIRITPDHRILFFNEYAQNFFGYSAEEVLGKSVLETIVPPVDSEGRDLRKMTQEITAHPEVHGSNDNENIRKDGSRIWIHWSNRALRDEHGDVREILCVGTDMTERRKLAREAGNYRRRLQQLADRFTATAEQERRRVATQIHDTVVQTLSLASIRLGGVLAALEKAGMSDERERVAGVRQLLEQGAKECRGLMEELVPSLLYEVGLLAALRGLAQKQSRTGGTRITVEGNEDAVVLDDALRGLLFQCARELVMNALKYAGQCEIQISVLFADGQVELIVQDNGRGFDPAALDGKEHDHTNGGFGFFSIRERLDGMGGQLDVDSTPGQGTIARVRVPLEMGP